jgi:hypothetical protein
MVEVGNRVDPFVVAPDGHRHLAKRRERRNAFREATSQRGHLRLAVRPDEAARAEHPSDEEDVDLPAVVEHQIRLIHRGEPLGRRAHSTSVERPSSDHEEHSTDQGFWWI